MNFKALLIKYKDVISYLFFGVCTTIINWASYYLLYSIFHVPNVVSVIIAWILAVLFAFITNKLFVFESRSYDARTLIHEIWTFTAARLLTGLLDLLIMYVSVDILGLDSTLWKFLSNIVVVILNYIFSKLIIFRRKKTNEAEESKPEDV